VERNQGEDEALKRQLLSPRDRRGFTTYLEILHQIVKHSQPIRILALIHVCQTSNLCGLQGSVVFPALSRRLSTHLERDVISLYPHFQLLPSSDILLWPHLVIFPILVSPDAIPQ
jgi:hypothetical protein